MNNQQVIKYFERIGLEFDPCEPKDIELIKKLQFAHVTTVPYETTEIVDRHPISLEEDDLFQKIVTEHRGGYCFELNGLFACLLRALGFEVTEYMGRFLLGEDEIPKPRHRVLSVKCGENKYFCDVGVGTKAPYHPLLIKEDTCQKQFGDMYTFKKDNFFGWILQVFDTGEWRDYISFFECPQLPKDFYTPSYYCENHPDSPFLYNMLSIKTDIGRMTIDKNVFKLWKNDSVSVEKLLSETEIEEYCEKYFALSLHR